MTDLPMDDFARTICLLRPLENGTWWRGAEKMRRAIALANHFRHLGISINCLETPHSHWAQAVKNSIQGAYT